jgi:hypothetical protein
MTYLAELRSALVDAAHRQHADAQRQSADAHARHLDAHTHNTHMYTRARAATTALWRPTLWRRSAHYGRAILASVVLGLTGSAVGAVHVGAPLGPEPTLSPSISNTTTPPGSAAPRP